MEEICWPCGLFITVLYFVAVTSSVSDTAVVPGRRKSMFAALISTLNKEFTMGTDSDEDTAERLNQSTKCDKTALCFQRSFCFICCALALLQTLQTSVGSCTTCQSTTWIISKLVFIIPDKNLLHQQEEMKIHTVKWPVHQSKMYSTCCCKGNPWGISERSKATISQRDYRPKLVSNF